ncbi:glycosyltransferase family 4 protein [Flexibacterium corallicola]|uniref:glycosyltransferase family 4 protein n=1 Tax=Flexibacterium corallicola TaxID=3037259 RepID=UPI00286F91D9|nr:glycosyltransferase family 4 protein [Pseudovibrio sp. M1P-2-3]
MKVAIVLPRNMDFSPEKASSIDLCVRDLALHSRFKGSTVVLGKATGLSFPELEFCRVGHINERTNSLQFIRELRRVAADVIVVHQHVPTARAVTKAFPETPIILHRHGASKVDGVWRQFRYRRIFKSFAAIISVSSFVREQLERTYPECGGKSVIVPNGIDTALWKSAKKQRKLTYVGRALESKGLFDLLHACAKAKLGDWKVELILAVTNEEEQTALAHTNTLLKTTGLVASVEMNLSYSDVRTRMSCASIVVVPSREREGFGRVVIEGMSCAAAVIATRAGGLAEAAGPHALYIPSGDENALKDALELLVNNGELRKGLGSAGRVWACETYDIRKVSAHYDKVLERVHSKLSLAQSPIEVL